MQNPIKIYESYLNQKDIDKNKSRKEKLNGRFTASGAGMCHKKQWYLVNNVEPKMKSTPSLRLLRLGTIVGQDFDKAMKWYEDKTDYKLYSEHPVTCPRLNLHGNFDLLVVDKDKKGHLYDYKTINMWGWRELFGKGSFGSPKDHYKLQLGTYAFMLEEAKELCDEVTGMTLVYYKKDDSVIKTKEIPLEAKELAELYWTRVHENMYQRKEEPPVSMDRFTPMDTWECNGYCDYADICPSPYKKHK